MKAYITGISGFAGSFLAEALLQKGHEVFGTHVSDNTQNIDHIKKDLQLEKLDMLDSGNVKKSIEKHKPDTIFHLAALTSPGESFKSPEVFFTNNITAEINLLEAVRTLDLSPRILITSSAEVYGLITEKDLPVDEDTKLRPGSPYAVSKIAQDYLGLQYFLSYGMDIVRVRPFNHVGPRQTPQFVVAAFAKQIAEIEKGHGKPTLMVGNLDAKRDFTDVRDMVQAYITLVEKGESGDVYNAGSGKSHRIGEVLDMLMSFSDKQIDTQIDPGKLRPSDVPDIRSNNKKIEALGWKAEITLEKTLEDTLNYWRQNI